MPAAPKKKINPRKKIKNLLTAPKFIAPAVSL
jgi:hypothetical protein